MVTASTPSRRLSSRVEVCDGVWVCWESNGSESFARVCNLGTGGLFIETPERRLVGGRAKLDFLVEEGQIRAEGVVQHIRPGKGLGLKFTQVREADRMRVAALLTRLRAASCTASAFRKGGYK